jgi:hypothetical protein
VVIYERADEMIGYISRVQAYGLGSSKEVPFLPTEAFEEN